MDCDQTVLLHFNFVLKVKSGSLEHKAAFSEIASALLQNSGNNPLVFPCVVDLKNKHSVNMNLPYFIFMTWSH